MCGLIGVAGDIDVRTKNIFTELLLVDVVRGHHSTGVASVSRKVNEIELAKLPVPSQMFVSSDVYGNLLKQADTKVLIGHNRYATIGEKSIANAHPFAFDNLVGAHNGTLDRWLLNRFPGDFGTDSETLFNSISLVGLKESIGKLNTQSAWALTWYDKETDTLNLLRNNKRPLSYCYSADRRRVFWGSEPDMLEWILRRNHVAIEKDSFYECEADKHYRWQMPEKAIDAFGKPLCVEVKPTPFVARSVNSYIREESIFDGIDDGYGPWYGYGTTGRRERYTSPTTSTNVVTLPVKKKGRIDTSKFRPPYKDAKGKHITKPQFIDITNHGCAFCDSNHSEWGEYIHILPDDYDGRKTYLCEDCYNDDDIYDLVENCF